MKFDKLSKILFNELNVKLKSNEGLYYFAKDKAKFEGWLKVEICNILSKYSSKIQPEFKRVDIKFEDLGIELKTINTNIRCEGVKNKTKPITNNISSVIKDIKKTKKIKF